MKQAQVIALNLAAGIDQSQHYHNSPFNIYDMENYEYVDGSNVPSRRCGWDMLASSGTVPDPIRMFENESCILAQSQGGHTYRLGTSDVWIQTSHHPLGRYISETNEIWKTLYIKTEYDGSDVPEGNNYQGPDGDLCTYHNYTVFAYYDPYYVLPSDTQGAIRIRVYDDIRKCVVYETAIEQTSCSGGHSWIRVTPANNGQPVAVITWITTENRSAYYLWGCTMSINATPNISTPKQITRVSNNSNDCPQYDIASIKSNTTHPWAVIYQNYGDTFTNVQKLSLALSLSAEIYSTVGVQTEGVAIIDGNDGSLWIGNWYIYGNKWITITRLNGSTLAMTMHQTDLAETVVGSGYRATPICLALAGANKINVIWGKQWKDNDTNWGTPYPTVRPFANGYLATSAIASVTDPTTGAAGTVGTERNMPRLVPATKGYYDGHNSIVWLADVFNKVHYLCSLDPDNQYSPTVITSANNMMAWGHISEKLQTISYGNDGYACALKVFSVTPTGGYTWSPANDTVFSINKSTWRANTTYPMAALGNLTYIGAGNLYQYDGHRTHESGYVMYPTVYCTTGNNPGAQVFPDGTGDGYWSYITLWETVDSAGNRHRSGTSAPYSIHIPHHEEWDPQWVKYFAAPLSLSHRNGVKILCTIYRTEKNGSEYYRVQTFEDMDYENIKSNTEVVAGDNWISEYDRTSDADLITHERLYAQPDGSGVGSHDPIIGGIAHMVECNRRLWMASAERPHILMYSTEYEFGIPVAYSLGQELDIGKRITGLASHEDGVIVFTEDECYLVYGNGPNAALDPTSGTFEIQKLRGTGCTQPRSIVSIPQGILFLGKDVLYIINRNLEFARIGNPIKTHLNNTKTVLDAVFKPDDNQVWYSLSSAKTIVIDLAPEGLGPQGSVISQPRFTVFKFPITPTLLAHDYMLDSTGNLYEKKPGTYVDLASFSATPIAAALTTNFTTFGVPGWKRIHNAAVRGAFEPCTIVVSADATDTDSIESFTAAQILSATRRGTAELTHKVAYQKGITFQVKFSDSGSTYGAHTLYDVFLEVSVPSNYLEANNIQ